jgi:hypothetical protein
MGFDLDKIKDGTYLTRSANLEPIFLNDSKLDASDMLYVHAGNNPPFTLTHIDDIAEVVNTELPNDIEEVKKEDYKNLYLTGANLQVNLEEIKDNIVQYKQSFNNEMHNVGFALNKPNTFYYLNAALKYIYNSLPTQSAGILPDPTASAVIPTWVITHYSNDEIINFTRSNEINISDNIKLIQKTDAITYIRDLLNKIYSLPRPFCNGDDNMFNYIFDYTIENSNYILRNLNNNNNLSLFQYTGSSETGFNFLPISRNASINYDLPTYFYINVVGQILNNSNVLLSTNALNLNINFKSYNLDLFTLGYYNIGNYYTDDMLKAFNYGYVKYYGGNYVNVTYDGIDDFISSLDDESEVVVLDYLNHLLSIFKAMSNRLFKNLTNKIYLNSTFESYFFGNDNYIDIVWAPEVRYTRGIYWSSSKTVRPLLAPVLVLNDGIIETTNYIKMNTNIMNTHYNGSNLSNYFYNIPGIGIDSALFNRDTKFNGSFETCDEDTGYDCLALQVKQESMNSDRLHTIIEYIGSHEGTFIVRATGNGSLDENGYRSNNGTCYYSNKGYVPFFGIRPTDEIKDFAYYDLLENFLNKYKIRSKDEAFSWLLDTRNESSNFYNINLGTTYYMSSTSGIIANSK